MFFSRAVSSTMNCWKLMALQVRHCGLIVIAPHPIITFIDESLDQMHPSFFQLHDMDMNDVWEGGMLF
jgi:hypothetical protein